MSFPIEIFRAAEAARNAASVSGATLAANITRRSSLGFAAFAFPRFFPRIEAEIFAFVAELFGACFQGSFFMGKMFFGVDFPRRTGFIFCVVFYVFRLDN